MTAIDVSLGEVAAALALVAVAVAVSLWRRAGMETDIGVAAVRAFVQLTAVGYVIKLVFDQDSLAFVFGLIAIMVVIAAATARRRAAAVPGRRAGSWGTSATSRRSSSTSIAASGRPL